MRGLIILLMLLLAGNVFAQNTENQLDAQGRKQGFWSKKDAGGRLLYQATFKNDQPVGEMKRFHPNGKLKAVLNFVEGSELSDAHLYDERGNLIAQGKYMGQKKTGEWTYFQESKILLTENYLNGEKNGISKRWFKTGELMEESAWKDGKLNGIYRIFFQDGQVYLDCNYVEGQRNGLFRTWLVDGTKDLEANYIGGLRDKDCKYFDKNGNLSFTLKFDRGKLLNPEVQDSINAAQFGALKSREDNVPDPERFMQDPEEYMRLIKTQ